MPRCLDSVLASGIEGMEVLLINDGSTDASADICMQYAAKDSRIVCCAQENRGAVAARNRGMDMAKGAYIMFIDADDYVSPGYVRALHETTLAAVADIVFCNILRLRKEMIVEMTDYQVKELTQHADKLALLKETYYPGPCAKIYRRSLLEDNGIRYLMEDGYFGFAEDMLFTLHATYAARKIVFCPGASYYYCMDNENSICSKPSIQLRNNNDRLIIIGHMLRFAQKKGLQGEELLQVLQAVENHLRWGGSYTLNTFMARLDVECIDSDIKKHFYNFADELKKEVHLRQRFKTIIKNMLLRIPILYKLASALRRQWHNF